MFPDPEPHGPLVKLAIAGFLLAFCVALHAAGLVGISRWLTPRGDRTHVPFLRDLWGVIRIAWVLLALHLLAILIWAAAYVALGSLPDMSTAFYFSAITYTTVGYGDVVLTGEWRTLSGAEALIGIFLMGLTTAFFFTFLGQALQHRLKH
jgi:hypothetical protein